MHNKTIWYRPWPYPLLDELRFIAGGCSIVFLVAIGWVSYQTNYGLIVAFTALYACTGAFCWVLREASKTALLFDDAGLWVIGDFKHKPVYVPWESIHYVYRVEGAESVLFLSSKELTKEQILKRGRSFNIVSRSNDIILFVLDFQFRNAEASSILSMISEAVPNCQNISKNDLRQ